ncbi:hypothetical protein BCR43DRAFT_438642, partial [Syncephalastrum racemosum]
NPTILLLYKIAFAEIYPQETYQQNYQSAVDTICTMNKRQFQNFLDKINSKEPLNKIRRICEKSIHYNDEVKVKLLGDSPSSPSSDELDFPDCSPMGPPSKSKHAIVAQDIDFIDSSGNEWRVRMDWQSCLKAGRHRNLLLSYSTPESLRVTYPMLSKKNKMRPVYYI